MSKRKQEVVNSDIGGRQSPASPLAVVGSGNTETVDNAGVSQHTDLCDRNRDVRMTEERKETTVSSRRAELVALSKFVNKAFTGWTIKTQN